MNLRQQTPARITQRSDDFGKTGLKDVAIVNREVIHKTYRQTVEYDVPSSRAACRVLFFFFRFKQSLHP